MIYRTMSLNIKKTENQFFASLRLRVILKLTGYCYFR